MHVHVPEFGVELRILQDVVPVADPLGVHLEHGLLHLVGTSDFSRVDGTVDTQPLRFLIKQYVLL